MFPEARTDVPAAGVVIDASYDSGPGLPLRTVACPLLEATTAMKAKLTACFAAFVYCKFVVTNLKLPLEPLVIDLATCDFPFVPFKCGGRSELL